jgi:predicted transposase/invertase (TIGR01784 family)
MREEPNNHVNIWPIGIKCVLLRHWKQIERKNMSEEIARFTLEDQRQYEESIKAYRDIVNAINTAKKEAREEGKAEGLAQGRAEGIEQGIEQGMAQGRHEAMLEMAKKLLAAGVDLNVIQQTTGLSAENLESIQMIK